MEKGRQPLVSVIIATYNSDRYLPEALESVFDQSYRNFEIIVVDDGSTDRTRELLAGYGERIRVLYQSNRGPSSARNAGIRASRGPYVCFLDADDVWYEDKLLTQVDFMQCNPHIGLVFADMAEFGGEGVQTKSLLSKSIFKDEIMNWLPISGAAGKLLIENFVPTSTVMIRRQSSEKAGTFDESLRASEDRELWSRIASHFEILCIPVVLGEKRLHESNASNNVEVTLRSRIQIWERARQEHSRALPPAALTNLLGDAYLHLGYVLLSRNQREEARQAGLRSLRCALQNLGRKREARAAYRWSLGLSLVPLTFFRGSVTHKMLRLKNTLSRS